MEEVATIAVVRSKGKGKKGGKAKVVVSAMSRIESNKATELVQDELPGNLSSPTGFSQLHGTEVEAEE
jgi:hypothetical protein